MQTTVKIKSKNKITCIKKTTRNKNRRMHDKNIVLIIHEYMIIITWVIRIQELEWVNNKYRRLNIELNFFIICIYIKLFVADQQFLIQVTSCPPKSKISTGPARLHIQDLRFSMTTGVPPRLAGVWELRHLRYFVYFCVTF